jgi:uncharacterized protein with PQ loop repeat
LEKIRRNYKELYTRAKQQAKDYRQTSELLAFYVGIIMPFSSLPQLYNIYTTHRVGGLSIITWGINLLGGSFILTYGILHRIKPVYYPQMLWMTVQTLTIIGILKYG